jgi:hypothetical protein
VGLTARNLASEEMERCHEIAGIAARLGAEAIQWSSATGAGQSLGVFVDQRRPGSHAEILRSIDLSNEMLISVAAGVADDAGFRSRRSTDTGPDSRPFSRLGTEFYSRVPGVVYIKRQARTFRDRPPRALVVLRRRRTSGPPYA